MNEKGKEIMSSERKLRVETHDPIKRFGAEQAASKLRLKGRWLRQAGFVAGDVVKVVMVSPGVIEVRKMSAPEVTEGYGEALAGLDRALALNDGKWQSIA